MRHEVILADPPWSEQGSGKSKRGADRHYPLMSTRDIIALGPGVKRLAADDSFLFLWATNNYLPDALAVMRAWGFTYKTNFVWCKNRFGLGFYNRGQHELCLLGRRGNPARSKRGQSNRNPHAKSIPSVLHADRREHSRKPDEFYEIVESFGTTYCELFARRTRSGWTSIGDELGVTLQSEGE